MIGKQRFFDWSVSVATNVFKWNQSENNWTAAFSCVKYFWLENYLIIRRPLRENWITSHNWLRSFANYAVLWELSRSKKEQGGGTTESGTPDMRCGVIVGIYKESATTKFLHIYAYHHERPHLVMKILCFEWVHVHNVLWLDKCV